MWKSIVVWVVISMVSGGVLIAADEPAAVAVTVEEVTADPVVVDVGGIIQDIAVAPGGSTVYASLDTNEIVMVTPGGVTGRVTVTAGTPGALAFSPDGATLYVALTDSYDVAVYNGLSYSTTYDLSEDWSGPWDLVASDDRLYAAGHDGFSIVDTTTGIELFYGGSLYYTHYTSNLALTADGTTLYSLNRGISPASLFVFDVVADTIELIGEDECHGCIGSDGREVVLSPDESQVYVACSLSYLQVLGSAPTLNYVNAGLTGTPPNAIVATPDGAYIFVGADDLTVIRTADWLPFYVGALQDSIASRGLALSADNATLAAVIGRYQRRQIQFVDVSSLAANRGGIKLRPMDNGVAVPVAGAYGSGAVGSARFFDLPAGFFGNGPVSPGTTDLTLNASGYDPVVLNDITITAGSWTDLGNVTMVRSGDLPGPTYINSSPPALVSQTRNIQIHGRTFLPGMTVTSNSSDVVIDSYSYVDWTTIDATVTVPAGVTAGYKSVTVTNTGGGTGSGYINVRHPPVPKVRFSVAVVEVGEANATYDISVIRSIPTSSTVTVDWATADNTAMAGADYVASSGTLTWPADDISPQTISVTVSSDILIEGDESFFIDLTNPVNVSVDDPGQCEVVIVDDDISYLQLSADSYSVDENGTQVEVRVTRTGGALVSSGVQVWTANGTATAPDDYTALVAHTCTWGVGDTTDCVVPITIADDLLDEGNESFMVSLSDEMNDALGEPSSATVTIIDDDHIGFMLSSATYTASEGAGTVTVTALRTGPSVGAVSVDYTTADGTATATQDYNGVAGTFSWGDGDAAPKSVAITLINDSTVENDETFTFTLSNPSGGATVEEPGSATVTITDNDSRTVQLAAATASLDENGSVGLTVTRSGETSEAVQVSYSAGGGTATSGADYQPASGTLSWADGDMSDRTITITGIDDNRFEGAETLLLTLSAPSANASLGSPSEAQVTIIDDEWSEIQINTYTTNLQTRPSVAMKENGGFRVVWESYGQDGSGWGVYSRRFNVTGSPISAEVRVNTTTANDQSNPEIAMNAVGTHVIVWQDSAADGSSSGIFHQRFNASGNPVGGQQQVNQYIVNQQREPSVAMDSAGRYMIVWQSYGQDGSGEGVYGRTYGADGVATSDEIALATVTTNNQKTPAVAAAPSGGFVVVWESNQSIHARRFSTAGVAQTNEKTVSSTTQGTHFLPDVVIAGNGVVTSVWQATGWDGDGYGVLARRNDWNLNPLGPASVVNTYVTSDQTTPAAGVAPDNQVVVVWESMNQDGSLLGIFGQVLTANGHPWGNELQMNTYTSSTQQLPSVAASGFGGFAAVWASAGQDGSGYGVHAVVRPSDLVFEDGFESGDTSAWSAAVP